MATVPSFDVVESADQPRGGVLIVGFSNLGLAGLTAVDHLIDHRNFDEVGHVTTTGVADLTPFANGEPRHPVRLYADPDGEVTVLASELTVPVWAAEPFADALVDWTTATGIEEVALLHGVPFPHGPDEHDVFFVATREYRERRLADGDVPPLEGGVLDGVVGELLARSMEGAAPPLGAFVTPIHPPGPDFEAAIRYLDLVRTTYGLDVDEAELRERSGELNRYYAELADRMKALDSKEGAPGDRHFPEDRMYM